MQTELNVKLWAIRHLFAIHLLLIFCIFLACGTADSVCCLRVCVYVCVYQCNVLHYLRDTEVIHNKHQKNDKQPWFWKMHAQGWPSIQHSHFLCITISQGHYTGQGSMHGEKSSDWSATPDEKQTRRSLVPWAQTNAHQSSFNVFNLTCAV